MLDYDAEAGRYDETRGGERRAAAAADAIDQLLPGPGQRVVDVAGGTGIVSAQLAARGHPDVYVSDRSVGMLQVASTRLPGHAVQADATSLPLLAGSMDAVTTIWLLHLLGIEAVGLVVAEVARVLRDGGRFITTVDKD
ncbi:MAG: class I SAM-dependent methyltransferase, partial [Nocardioidaceae bacterium]